ncbi:MAG: site-specific integrase [Bacilli bacterium]
MTDQELFKEFLEFKAFKERQSNMDMSTYEPEKKKSKKFIPRRRAKGTGSIYSIGSNRRKPWVASVTLGYDDDDGHQIKKLLGTFKSQQEAQNALSAYELQKSGIIENNSLINMKDIDKPKVKCPTFKKIWDIILIEDLSHLTERSLSNYKVSFNHFKRFHDTPINQIKLIDIKPIFIDMIEKGTGISKQNNMKIILNYIFTYAVDNEYITRNIIDSLRIRDTNECKKEKRPFTDEELCFLKKNDDNYIIKSLLVLCYTGMRPSELLKIKISDVHLEERYMIGGIKTKSGIDRVIPIHESILPYITYFIKVSKNEYLFLNGCVYQTYFNKFNILKEELNISESLTLHCGRHTFATLSEKYKLSLYSTKLIMGHSSKDLTLDTYTHKDINELVEEINKIKFIC